MNLRVLAAIKMKPRSNSSWPCMVLFALGVAATFCVRSAHAQLFSPGDLADVHWKWNSDNDCTQCHTGGRGLDPKLCNVCHDDIGRQRAKGEGLHGTRFKKDDCGHCHVEHRGRSHDLIRWPGGSLKKFEHAITGFELKGGHAKVECRDCHTQKNRRNAKTFLLPPNTCGECHKKDDAHKGRFGTRCNDCHNDQKWKGVELKLEDHAKTRFPLRGKHKKVECKSCHHEPPRYRELDFATCESCHKDPHKGRLGGDCESCHSETGWDDLTMSRKSHPGLSIFGGHSKVECTGCHDRGVLKPPARGSRCVDCHKAVHEAEFGDNCKRCHRDIRWLGLPDKIGRNAHHLTAFALAGKHKEVACESCHPTSMTPAKRYRGLDFDRCTDCHKDAHGGALSRYGDGDCVTCHNVHGFAPTLFSVEQHAKTSFPLIGRHVAVACGNCHRIEPPRLDWSVTHQQCADCHENPHGHQFDKEMAAGGCASCHSPVAWNAPNIDHSIWPLTGAHELVACAACHEPSEEDRKAGGGASYRGVPRECEGCHEDVHRGQFRLSDPKRDCVDCHTTTQFQIHPFPHQKIAGYPLEGGHASLKCDECHKRETLRNQMEAVRYRLGYRDCNHCHADPHAGGEQ